MDIMIRQMLQSILIDNRLVDTHGYVKIRMFGVPLPYRIDNTDVSSSTTQQLDDDDRVPTEPTQIL